ncbi:hypothetical protein BMS3Abin16_00540 [archaeon BMS3Abin16]|nr:hypothetical protein BMS3Abin16_00540 [archaeon BMS3Abin16]
MIMRKCISIEKKYLDKLTPLMENHSNNLSSTFREIIDLADLVLSTFGEINMEELKVIFGKGSFRDSYISDKEGVLMAYSLYNWFLKGMVGVVPPLTVLKEFEVPKTIKPDFNNVENWNVSANKIFDFLGLPVKFYADHESDENVKVCIKGLNPSINEFSAMIISAHVADSFFNYTIKTYEELSASIRITFEKGESLEAAYTRMTEFFGRNQKLFTEIWGKPSFWRNVVTAYETGNYDMVLMTKKEFDKLNSRSPDAGIEYVEKIVGGSWKKLSFEDYLKLFKEATLSSGIVDRIEVNGAIEVFHSYEHTETIDRVESWLLNFLNAHGTTFSVTRSKNVFIFSAEKALSTSAEGVKQDLKPPVKRTIPKPKKLENSVTAPIDPATTL